MTTRSTAETVLTVEVWTYARYSSDRQHERSIDDQEAACDVASERAGLPAASRRFRDAALSGTSTARRVGLRDLLSAAATPVPTGGGRVLVVESLDRLGRNMYDSFDIVRRLHRDGRIRIVTVDGRDSDSPAFKAMLLADSFVADVFIDNLRTHVRRGLEGRVREGRWVTKIPRGYRVDDDQRLVVDDTTARDVRRHFELAASGMPVSRIVRAIRQETGRRVSRTAVRNRLRDPVYRGGWRFRGEVVRQDESLRIVSDHVWNAVQVALDRRAEAASATGRAGNLAVGGALARRAPLAGLFRCAICGTPVRASGGVRKYYRCGAASDDGDCTERFIRAEPLEHAVVDAALAVALDATAIDYIVREVERRIRRASVDSAGDRRAAAKALRDAEGALARCVQHIEVHGPSGAMQARIRELEASLPALRARAASLPTPPAVAVLHATIESRLRRAADALRGAPRDRLRATLEPILLDGRLGHGADGAAVASFRVAPLGVFQELIVPRTFSDAMATEGARTKAANSPGRGAAAGETRGIQAEHGPRASPPRPGIDRPSSDPRVGLRRRAGIGSPAGGRCRTRCRRTRRQGFPDTGSSACWARAGWERCTRRRSSRPTRSSRSSSSAGISPTTRCTPGASSARSRRCARSGTRTS
jgi:site-specific DNA recombinase